MANENLYNGLDPTVWGEYAHFDIRPEGQTELELALELLGKASEILYDLCEGKTIVPDRAAFLHDDIASAATHFGWWMEMKEMPDDAE